MSVTKSLIFAFCLIINACGVSLAQNTSPQIGFSTPPFTDLDSSRNSIAVRNDSFQAVQQYAIKKLAGRLTSSDVEVAAAAMKTLFDNFEETGYNAALQKHLLEDGQSFFSYHPSDGDIAKLANYLSLHGTPVSPAHIRSVLDLSDSDREAFLAMIRNQGVYQTEMQMVAEFRQQELQAISQSASSSGKPIRATYKRSNGKLLKATLSYQAAFCLAAAGLGLGSGCGIMPACVAAFTSCAACALSSCGY